MWNETCKKIDGLETGLTNKVLVNQAITIISNELLRARIVKQCSHINVEALRESVVKGNALG